MKKRACHYHCKTCRLSFEDIKRYGIHLSSRRHFVEDISSADNSGEKLLVQDENLDEETILHTDDEGEDFAYFARNESESGENPREINQLEDEDVFFPQNERQENFSEEFESDNGSEFGEEGNDSDDDNSASDFYPFPSKNFFLLYCYVHNICRPQVWILYCF